MCNGGYNGVFSVHNIFIFTYFLLNLSNLNIKIYQ